MGLFVLYALGAGSKFFFSLELRFLLFTIINPIPMWIFQVFNFNKKNFVKKIFAKIYIEKKPRQIFAELDANMFSKNISKKEVYLMI